MPFIHRKHELPSELRDIDATLRRARPSLSEDRLRQVVAGVKSRQEGNVKPRYSKESFLRTRLAITAMLVVGFALSGAGAGLAVSGISGDDTSSSSAAYNQPTQGQTTLTPDTTTPTTQQIVPTGTETPQPPAPAPDQGLLGEEESGSAPDEAAAPGEEAEVTPQETRQLAAQPGGDELPFTGWAAIPVLLIGLALVGGGVVMRKSIARKSS